MFGLVGLMPDYAMIVVGANMGVSRMTKEHLGIALALGVPIFIVVTKIDIAPKNVYDDTMKTLMKILKSPYAAKHPVQVRDVDDVSVYANSMIAGTVCPVFAISNVTSEGIPKLTEFLALLKSRVY
jgi:elongation factor 1-alpha